MTRPASPSTGAEPLPGPRGDPAVAARTPGARMEGMSDVVLPHALPQARPAVHPAAHHLHPGQTPLVKDDGVMDAGVPDEDDPGSAAELTGRCGDGVPAPVG